MLGKQIFVGNERDSVQRTGGPRRSQLDLTTWAKTARAWSPGLFWFSKERACLFSSASWEILKGCTVARRSEGLSGNTHRRAVTIKQPIWEAVARIHHYLSSLPRPPTVMWCQPMILNSAGVRSRGSVDPRVSSSDCLHLV